MSGRRSDAGDPGGSASYAASEKTSRPMRLRLLESAASVPPMREYVSVETLAERSSTSTVLASCGRPAIVRVSGLRDRNRNAATAPRASAANPPRTASVVRALGRRALASASGIALIVPALVRHRRRGSPSPAAREQAPTTRDRRQRRRATGRGCAVAAQVAPERGGGRAKADLLPHVQGGGRGRARPRMRTAAGVGRAR